MFSLGMLYFQFSCGRVAMTDHRRSKVGERVENQYEQLEYQRDAAR
jgi:hypothetical protein